MLSARLLKITNEEDIITKSLHAGFLIYIGKARNHRSSHSGAIITFQAGEPDELRIAVSQSVATPSV